MRFICFQVKAICFFITRLKFDVDFYATRAETTSEKKIHPTFVSNFKFQTK